MQKNFKNILVLLFVLSSILTLAQREKENSGNLTRFYKYKVHFGFALGVNQTDFRLHTVPNSQFPNNYQYVKGIDTSYLRLKSITSKPEAGFNLGIVSDFRLHDYVRLRFLPNLAFASRSLNYYFTGDDTITVVKKIESTFINFPLLLKLQSKRLHNFGAYVVGGFNYSIDLASGKRAKADPSIIRLKSNDYYYEAGGGADFYLQYFKLALEFKLSIGMKNILIKDGTPLTDPINKLNSHMFLFSLTFEG